MRPSPRRSRRRSSPRSKIRAPSVVDAVGSGGQSGEMIRLPASAKLPATDGKPLVVFVGAEYCPYCAAERWVMVMWLSRFGTFKQSLRDSVVIHRRLSRHRYLHVLQVDRTRARTSTSAPNEIEDRNQQPLQTMSAGDPNIFTKYDDPPYTIAAAASSHSSTSAGCSPSTPRATSRATLQACRGARSQRSSATRASTVTKAIIGNANILTAATCIATGDHAVVGVRLPHHPEHRNGTEDDQARLGLITGADPTGRDGRHHLLGGHQHRLRGARADRGCAGRRSRPSSSSSRAPRLRLVSGGGGCATAITPFALQMAWIVAVLATFGSLFLQFFEHFDPCEFCWFQRICMYPLSLLLGIAAFRGEMQVCEAILHRPVRGRRGARHLPLPAGAHPARADRVRQRGAVQRRGHQYLRIHLRPVSLDGRISRSSRRCCCGARQQRRIR